MKKRGQVWVETVIYTLIAMVLIGLVLAFVTPKIQEIQDKVTIQQSIDLMSNLDNIISNIGGVSGNKRIVDISIKKGTFKIVGENDSIVFQLESNYEYSQPGEVINISDISVITEKKASTNIITLTSSFPSYDITYDGLNQTKILGQSATPYKLSIENKDSNGNKVINIVVS